MHKESNEIMRALENGRALAMPAVLVLLAASTIACRPHLANIRTPEYAAVGGEGSPSSAEMGKLVQMGAIMAGWQVIDDDGSAVTAEVSAGGHSATVAITYDAGGYSIMRLETSPGLKYDEERQHVHKRYNFWVDRLDRYIRQEINKYLASRVGQGLVPPAPPEPAPAPAPAPQAEQAATLPPAPPAEPTTEAQAR